MRLAAGDSIPLELQLDDGATNMFPRALLYNSTGALIATIDLAHIANGRYADDTQTMSDVAYVAATYIVYSDSGHTTESFLYGRSMDLFELASDNGVHLQLQLDDGSAAQFPRALVYDPSGALVATVNLPHVANGRYADDSLTIPQTGYRAAVYITYSDSGHSVEGSYARSLDLFIKDTSAALLFPAISNATTAESIRDRIIAVISALTPKAAPINGFFAYRNEGDGNLITFAEKNPANAYRRFQVRYTGDDETPVVSNTDYDERSTTMVITIAYPQNARTGNQNALDRDDAMDVDFHQIDYAVGVFGRANFSPPSYPDAVPRGLTKQIERGRACDFLILTETFTYRRSSS